MTTGLQSVGNRQSYGETIVARRDDLHAVRVLTRRRLPASDLAVALVLLRFQTRGIALSHEAAKEIAREVLVAEAYARER